MPLQQQIQNYLNSLPQNKRADMAALHQRILEIMPGQKLWFDDGTDATGKTVSNPSIGYGTRTTTYADGKTREYYRIGISANTSGISIYILGIADKTYLAQTYGQTIGKATVTGYCIKFKSFKDIDMEVLEAAIRYGAGLV